MAEQGDDSLVLDANLRIKVKDKKELIHFAVQELIKERGDDPHLKLTDREDSILLSRLLSQGVLITRVSFANAKGVEKQNFVTYVEAHFLLFDINLESLKEDLGEQQEPAIESEGVSSSDGVEASVKDDSKAQESREMSTEEIVKELRKVKRQNTITHWLLSIMIVVTTVWQLSEVSLILRVKNSVSNPFKSFGNMLKGFLKDAQSQHERGILPSSRHSPVEAPPLPSIKIPELPSGSELFSNDL